MDARLSLVTLGVRDVAAATAFYRRLGFRPSGQSQPAVTFFDCGGVVLALFGARALAVDAAFPEDARPPGDSASGPGFRGVTLARNVASPAEVDAVLAAAVAAGARLVKPGQPVFWGGYSGYFADPDGHLWEVAHNPFWPLAPDGRLQLPD